LLSNACKYPTGIMRKIPEMIIATLIKFEWFIELSACGATS